MNYKEDPLWDQIRTNMTTEDREALRFRHSSECTARLHGESLAGALKVRWTDGTKTWYKDCCAGVMWTEEEYASYISSRPNQLV